MKKTLILFFCLLPLALYNANAQRIIVNNDSLRVHFRCEPPNKVLEYYSKNWVHMIDYKGLYYDEELKGYLMQWLDGDVIVNQNINNYKRYLVDDFDKEEKKSFTRYYVVHDLKMNFDSVYSNPDMYESYYDLAVSAAVDKYKSDILKSGKKLLPPYEVLYLHSKTAYPEAYKKIKQWWYENNKEITTNNGRISELFYYLLLMNDNEAQSIFDKIITDIVNKKNEYNIYNLYIQLTDGGQNAYFIKKLLELLSVKIEFEYLAGYEATYYRPLDILIYDDIKQLLKTYNMDVDIFNIPYKTEKEYTKEIRKRKNIIIKKTEELIQKLEADEQYWMQNMPFDYVPKIIE